MIINALRHIPQQLALQRSYFATGATRPIAARIRALKALQTALPTFEDELMAALHRDLHKPDFEAYATEVGFVYDELRYTIKHLAKWAAPRRVPTPVVHFPASSHIHFDPYGVALIIAPWNYPLQLALVPLIGALAAGNCAVLKPSELTPHTSEVLARLIRSAFDPELVTVVEGDARVSQALLDERFDYIFFTGSVRVGQLVMEKAARHLTPVTLELGGKSPCVVHRDARLELAARRIVWGKFLNAGQTCVAPDYVLVHETVKEELIGHMQQVLKQFYGEDPTASADYPRIVNDGHFARLTALMQHGTVRAGGHVNAAERYIAPTLIDDVTWDDPIMQDEIFGPLLPILTYRDLPEAIATIQGQPRPLAAYLFSESPHIHSDFLQHTSFGGGCINDTIVHLASPHLPFGGTGSSGIGGYHGQHSFETFSHRKSVMTRGSWLDLPLRYPPYDALKQMAVRALLR